MILLELSVMFGTIALWDKVSSNSRRNKRRVEAVQQQAKENVDKIMQECRAYADMMNEIRKQ